MNVRKNLGDKENIADMQRGAKMRDILVPGRVRHRQMVFNVAQGSLAVHFASVFLQILCNLTFKGHFFGKNPLKLALRHKLTVGLK